MHTALKQALNILNTSYYYFKGDNNLIECRPTKILYFFECGRGPLQTGHGSINRVLSTVPLSLVLLWEQEYSGREQRTTQVYPELICFPKTPQRQLGFGFIFYLQQLSFLVGFWEQLQYNVRSEYMSMSLKMLSKTFFLDCKKD